MYATFADVNSDSITDLIVGTRQGHKVSLSSSTIEPTHGAISISTNLSISPGKKKKDGAIEFASTFWPNGQGYQGLPIG